VGKGPRSDETCDWVREHCDTVIAGNWDLGLGNREFPADGFYWNQLGEERLAWLRSLPTRSEMTISGLRFILVHGRPVIPLLQGYDPDAAFRELSLLQNEPADTGMIFGDSHRAFIRTVDGRYMINTGSVGNNLGGIPRVHAILMDGKDNASTPGELQISMISLIYNNRAEAEFAATVMDLPKREAYVREVLTGHYSR